MTSTSQENDTGKTSYQLLQDFLVGDFDNQRQIDRERAKRKESASVIDKNHGDGNNNDVNANDSSDIHPYAVHINRIINSRINGIPDDFHGCFILEESYYTYLDKPNDKKTSKPHIFLVQPGGTGMTGDTSSGTQPLQRDSSVTLTPIQIPHHIPLEDLRNDNPTLRFEYSELKPISWITTPLQYERSVRKRTPKDGTIAACYDNLTQNEASIEDDDILHVNQSYDIGKDTGKRFTLIETFSYHCLEVMEIIDDIQSGQRVSPQTYTTPILYDRKS